MTNSMLEILRTNLRFFRKLKNLSQEKLGEMTDISKDYLSEIERGKKTPSLKRLILIAQALDIEVYRFFIKNEDAN